MLKSNICSRCNIGSPVASSADFWDILQRANAYNCVRGVFEGVCKKYISTQIIQPIIDSDQSDRMDRQLRSPIY